MAEQTASMTMAASESIAARAVRLNQLFLEKSSTTVAEAQHLLSRETLLDSLSVLYDECLQDAMKKDRNVAIFVEKFRPTISTIKKLRVNVGDFEMKKVIGRGHFGDVHVVREKHTGNVYAMKILRKSETLGQQNVAFYDEERDIMAKANSEWITRLHYSFQDVTNLYLIMEFLPGGDLLSLIDRHDGILSEDVARFFLAEIVLAIHALHSMGYVHRDIKPDNVLVDRTGHVKLADFGSAAKLSRYDTVSSKMPVGTPDYIAPEVLASIEGRKGSYGRSCDFWSLGVVAFEMLYGSTPFSDTKVTATYNNIMNYKKSLKFNDVPEVSEKARDLIVGLLTDAMLRLDFEGLYRHQFFETINWEGIRESLPPFVPNVIGQDDTSNFEEFSAIAPKAEIPDLPKVTATFSGKNLPFVGFTYTGPLHFSTECVSTSPSRKSLSNLESQLLSKKKEISDMRLKIDSLEKLDAGARAELVKLTSQLTEQGNTKFLAERESERLCKELAVQKSQCVNYKRMVELERTERVKTETKAVDMLKQWRNAEKQKFDLMSKENDSLKQFVRELERKYRDTRIDALTLRDEMASVVKMAENATMKANHYKEKLRRSSSCDAVTLDNVRQQLTLAENQLLCAANEKEKLDVKLDMFKSKVENLESVVRRLEESQRDTEADRVERVQRVYRELDHVKSELSVSNQLLADKDSELAACNERIEELSGRLRDELCCQQTVQQQFHELVKQHEENEAQSDECTGRPSNRQSFRRAQLKAKLEEMESELCRVKCENERLQDELFAAKDSDSEKTQTVEELRVIVDRLENGLKLLDAEHKKDRVLDEDGAQSTDPIDVDRERIAFEAKISHLEAQLEKSRERLFQENQTVRELRTECFKVNRELRDVKLDLRIAARESKTTTEQLTDLQQKATASHEACEKAEYALDTLKKEASVVRLELEANKKELQRKENCWENEKLRLTEKINTMQASCHELRDLHTRLGETDGRSKQLEIQMKNAEDQLKCAVEDKRRAQKREDQARAELKKSASEKDVLQMNLDCLKQAIQSMEEQLSDYEQLVEVHESEEARLKDEVNASQKMVESLRKEVKRASESAADERAKAENAMRGANECIHRMEMADLAHGSAAESIAAQRNEYRSMVTELSQQVAELEGELRAYEGKLSSSQYRQAALDEETLRIKEEAAQLITQIHALRDTNLKISRSLADAEEGRITSENRCLEFESTIREERVAHQVQRVKLEETIGQQTKLIHFLQMKAEAAQKRKKTLTEKLFGSRNGNDSKEQFPRDYSVAYRHPEASSDNGTHNVHHNSGLKKTTEIPSPQSKEVLNTLTKSPGVQEVPGRSPAQKVTLKPSKERMRHNIPHQFQTGLCMHATKCAACLDSIHFGRNVARCKECRISAHPKCSASLPNACKLPMDLMQHFRHSMRFAKGTSSKRLPITGDTRCSSSQLTNISGWLKVPKTGSHGWERMYARLDGSALLLYEEIGDNEYSESPTEKLELCSTAADGTAAKVIEAITPLEMTTTAKSDLPYIFKLVIQPSTTCWPARCIYFMAHSFQEKLDWVAALEKLIKSNSSAAVLDNVTLGAVLLSIEDASNVDLNCVAFLTEDIVLIGTEDGLSVVDLMEDKNAQPKLCIPSFGAVYQMSVVSSIGILILIVGNERRLYWMNLTDVCSLVNGQAEFTASHLSMLHSVDNVSCCHLFVVKSPADDKTISTDSSAISGVYLCAATTDELFLLKWNASMKSFCVRKEIISKKPCSCVMFTENSVVFGSDKFYEIDLSNLSVEDFLDESDRSLYHVIHGADLHDGSFPMAMFCVSPAGTQPEYLLCFYELGIFVDAFGRRSRRNDLRWTHLPLAFAFRWPYLYIVHFSSIEVYEIIVHKEKCFSVQTFVDLPSPRYLGASNESGTIIVAVIKDGQADVVCFNGEAAIKRKASKTIDPHNNFNNNNDKISATVAVTDDESNCESEFSFSSSVMQALQEDDEVDGVRRHGHESEV